MKYHIEYYPESHVTYGKNADGTSADKVYKGWYIEEAWIPVPLDVVDEMTFDDGTTFFMVDVNRDTPEIAFTAAYRMIQWYIKRGNMTINEFKKERVWNFAMWTSMNLAHCVDFIQSIIEQHGDLCGDYEPLSGIVKALESNISYAEEVKKEHEDKTDDTC